MTMSRARSINKQLKKSISVLLPSPSSSSSSSSVNLFGTTKSSITRPSFLRCLSCSKTLTSKQSFFFSSSSNFHKRIPIFSFNSSHHGGAFIVRGLSSITPPLPHSVEVNHPADPRSVVNGSSCNTNKEDLGSSVPVRAYYFSTSIDLAGLGVEYLAHLIPCTSIETNYIVLRFGDANSHPRITLSESPSQLQAPSRSEASLQYCSVQICKGLVLLCPDLLNLFERLLIRSDLQGREKVAGLKKKGLLVKDDLPWPDLALHVLSW